MKQETNNKDGQQKKKWFSEKTNKIDKTGKMDLKFYINN